jgi:hypothetical protein
VARTEGVRRLRRVEAWKPSRRGLWQWRDRGGVREEETEWLSNNDAFPAVVTMAWAAMRPRTKGVRWGSG